MTTPTRAWKTPSSGSSPIAHEVAPAELQRWALGFSEPVFHHRMSAILEPRAAGVPA